MQKHSKTSGFRGNLCKNIAKPMVFVGTGPKGSFVSVVPCIGARIAVLVRCLPLLPVGSRCLSLDYCHGYHELRFHAGGSSIAPVFCTHNDDCDCYAYDLILLRGGGHHQCRVGPVAKLMGRLLLLFRGMKRRQLELET